MTPGAAAPAARMRRSGLPAEAARLARHAPDLVRIWSRGRLDPKLREAVMLAVAQANGCRACSTAHRAWALREGVSDAELAALENQDPSRFDRRTWAAIAWAQERARSPERRAPDELEAELARRFTAPERRDLALVADAMTVVNRLVATVERLPAGRRRRRVPGPAPADATHRP